MFCNYCTFECYRELYFIATSLWFVNTHESMNPLHVLYSHDKSPLTIIKMLIVKVQYCDIIPYCQFQKRCSKTVTSGGLHCRIIEFETIFSYINIPWWVDSIDNVGRIIDAAAVRKCWAGIWGIAANHASHLSSSRLNNVGQSYCIVEIEVSDLKLGLVNGWLPFRGSPVTSGDDLLNSMVVLTEYNYFLNLLLSPATLDNIRRSSTTYGGTWSIITDSLKLWGALLLPFCCVEYNTVRIGSVVCVLCPPMFVPCCCRSTFVFCFLIFWKID